MLDIRRLSMGPMAASLSTSSAARSPARDRVKECTHTHMTRLYERDDCERKQDGYERCSLCHRRSPLGWLYRCSQDTAGALPASDYSNIQYYQKPGQDARLYTLSPSLANGVEQGHYTDEQFELLIKQKQEVREKVLGTQISISTASTQSSLSSIPASATFSTLCSSGSDTDPEIFTDQLYRKPLAPIREIRDVDLDDAFSTQAACLTEAEQVPAPCTFKVCHPCRPIYRDRAWGSLNTILNEHVAAPPMHELANRRVSDVNIVKHIGSRKKHAEDDADRYWVNDGSKAKKTNPAEFQSTVRRILRSSQLPSLNTDIAQDHMRDTTSFEDLPAKRDMDRDAAMAALMSPLYLRRGSKSPMQLDLTATTSCLYKDKANSSPRLEIGGYPTSPPITPQTGMLNGRRVSAGTPTSDKKGIISRLWRTRSVNHCEDEHGSKASPTKKNSTENDKIKRDSTGAVLAFDSEIVVDRFHID